MTLGDLLSQAFQGRSGTGPARAPLPSPTSYRSGINFAEPAPSYLFPKLSPPRLGAGAPTPIIAPRIPQVPYQNVRSPNDVVGGTASPVGGNMFPIGSGGMEDVVKQLILQMLGGGAGAGGYRPGGF